MHSPWSHIRTLCLPVSLEASPVHCSDSVILTINVTCEQIIMNQNAGHLQQIFSGSDSSEAYVRCLSIL